jgi:hypothetical protein
MKKQLDFSIRRQPDDLTCGPTCLHSVYQYLKLPHTLEQVISEVEMLGDGGTLASNLGAHAIDQGLDTKIYTFNVKVFDPTWFSNPAVDIKEKLRLQSRAKAANRKLAYVSEAYMRYLEKGGTIDFEVEIFEIVKEHLLNSTPIIAGLSATYLYRCMREIPDTMVSDDVKGEPSGHFVVLTGIDMKQQTISVSDPYKPNPYSEQLRYEINANHLMSAILLGVVTYDANLLTIKLPEVL